MSVTLDIRVGETESHVKTLALFVVSSQVIHAGDNSGVPVDPGFQI